jgi:hypothetical protein
MENPSGAKSLIPADLRRLVFTYAVKQGGEKEYEAILKVYHKPSNPSDKIAAMSALCASKHPELISRTLSVNPSLFYNFLSYLFLYCSLIRVDLSSDFILNGEVKEQDL